MSRVGKHEVKVPSTLSVTVNGRQLTFKGKTATEIYSIPEGINFDRTETGIKLVPQENTTTLRSLWGTTQRNLSNIVMGLDKGFTINVELIGVGYRAAVAGNKLTLQLGFSHEVVYEIPAGIAIKCEKPTVIAVSGHSKQLVGQVVAKLRTYRPPEPYKGKGIHREGDFVIRKEGKKK